MIAISRDWRAISFPRLIWSFSGLALAACAAARPSSVPDLHAALGNVETTVFLIGDTGEPGPAGRSVLDGLRDQARRARGERVILFLGDNVYPNGIPDSLSVDRPSAEDRLRMALDVVRASGARGIFLPGNHDWGLVNEIGALAREERFIAHASGGAAQLLPSNGCPGPAIIDIGDHLRLTALDTEWWLRAPELRAASGCPMATEAMVAEGLRVALDAAGERQILVAGHHPLVSGGPHGGHFGWREHVFPFRDVADWLWLPLPLVGSAYPMARSRAGLEEDIFGAANGRMRSTLESAFLTHPPLIYAAGHDHGLQLLSGTSARFLLVSGGGSDGNLHSVHSLPSTLFAQSINGFMQLDVLRDGRVRLSVLTVDAAGAAGLDGPIVTERFATWLR
jgi:hypothetical protein